MCDHQLDDVKCNNCIPSDKTNIVLAKMEYFRNWYCQVKRKEKTCKKYMPSSPATQHDQMALLNSK